MIIEKEKTIGQIVADDYRTAAIFKSFGIDFCCKGNRTISEVCNQKNISAETLREALEKTIAQERYTKRFPRQGLISIRCACTLLLPCCSPCRCGWI